MLRFESLSPDPGNDWVGRALSEEIAGQLEGTRHNAIIPFPALRQLNVAWGTREIASPGVSTERTAAIVAGANRILTGYYTVRDNQLTVTAVEEDLDKRKTIASVTVGGALDNLLHQTDQIAHDIDEEAHPSPTGSARALRSYTLGLESSTEDAARLYNEAIRLDPDFGKPYVQLATLALAGGNTTEFNQIFAAARQRSGISPVDRAFLNLLDARQHASLSTRIDALGALVRLMPADPFRLEELGSAELEAGRYTEAADHYRRLGMMLPASTEPLNMLGYALMYAGDEPGATKTFETYQRSAPNDANATDSRGDAAFFFGHFAEAQRFYLQAHQQNPALGEGSELLKAAWARLMQNDPERRPGSSGAIPTRTEQGERSASLPSRGPGAPVDRRRLRGGDARYTLPPGKCSHNSSRGGGPTGVVAILRSRRPGARPKLRTRAGDCGSGEEQPSSNCAD